MKTVTFLIPAYNCEKTIARTIESLDIRNNQNDIEVVIVDDESTDKTPVIVAKYVKKFPRVIKYFRKANGNYGSIINFIKGKINTRYIRLLDSDDTLCVENIPIYIKHLKNMNNDIDIVFTNFSFYNFDNNKRTKNSLTSWFKLTQKNLTCSFDNFKCPPTAFVTIHSITFSNDVFLKIKSQPENIYYTDTYLLYQLFKYSKSFTYIPHLYIYNYFVSNANQSININRMIKNKDQVLTVLKYMVEDNIPNNFSRDRISWLTSLIRMFIKFYLMVVSFENVGIEKKQKDIDDLILYLKTNIRGINVLYSIFSNSIKLLLAFKVGTISKIIKIAYKVYPSKFVKASKSKTKIENKIL